MLGRRAPRLVAVATAALCLAACAPSPVVKPTGVPATTASSAPATTAPITTAPVSTPSAPPSTTVRPKVVDVLSAPMSKGMSSPKVRELQARLRQAKAYAYLDVADAFGDQTDTSVRLYQQRHQLPVNGIVDQAMWDRLINETDAPSAEELANAKPGRPYVIAEVPGLVREAQHRLTQLGLYKAPVDGSLTQATKDAVTAFQQQQALPVTGTADERTWLRLTYLTRNPSAAELGIQPGPVMPQRLDPRCQTGARVICISMKEFRATYLTDGTPVTSWEGRFGSKEFPTVPGVHAIHLKDWTTVSTIYGERFPMPYAMFFHEDRAVHFSFDFLREGFDGHSHGCMNMRDYATLKWLYERIQVGDKVVVYND